MVLSFPLQLCSLAKGSTFQSTDLKTGRHDDQLNDTLDNGTQHNVGLVATIFIRTLSTGCCCDVSFMLKRSECRYAECRSTKCRGALSRTPICENFAGIEKSQF
jgi:hypothetical protein